MSMEEGETSVCPATFEFFGPVTMMDFQILQRGIYSSIYFVSDYTCVEIEKRLLNS